MPSKLHADAARWLPCLLALSSFAALSACDAQVSPVYAGEALLTMNGSVHIVHDSTEGALRPALAFVNQARSEIQLVDTEVKGEFPAAFTIHVYDPPPESMLFQLTPDSAERRMAIAYVTAVTAAHPTVIQYADNASSTAGTSSGPGGDAGTSPTVDQTSLCTHDGKTCYTETVTCPQPDSPPSACTVTHTGDASLTDDPFKSFAGISQNYAIVYLSAPLAAGTQGALALGTFDALSQGYNLLALRPLTSAEQARQSQCAADAEAEALVRFNRAHGTSYDTLAIAGQTCRPCLQPNCPPPSAATCPPAASQAEIAAYGQVVTQVKVETRCSDANIRSTRVADPAHEQITVIIGSGLEPWDQQSLNKTDVSASASPVADAGP